MAEVEKQNIHMSTVYKQRKNLNYLQQMKDRGEKIVQMCPAELGPIFALAAEMVGCDICRIPSMLSLRSGNSYEESIMTGSLTIKKFREYTNIIHLNFYMPTATYADKYLAVRWGSEWVFYGADSMLPMGVTNEVLKFMSDNYVPTFGHIRAISGWQTNATGYKKVGKTAEDAFRIFKWGYEYQENGMGGMTIELTPIEVSGNRREAASARCIHCRRRSLRRLRNGGHGYLWYDAQAGFSCQDLCRASALPVRSLRRMGQRCARGYLSRG